MRKADLRKLKRINATPKIVQMAKENRKEMVYKSIAGWSATRKDTKYDALIRCQTRGAYLMIAVFFPKRLEEGEMTPTYEIYCNPEGDEYITRFLKNGEEQNWPTAMADNLEGLSTSGALSVYDRRYYRGIEKRIWQNPEGKETIKNFLGTKEQGIYGLIEWQRKIREKNILEKEEREQAPWDADMKLVTEIMPSFENWMKKEAADEYFIIYEYKNRAPKDGWCSGCQRMVPVTAPKNNKKGICKRCGRDITYKAAGRIKTLATGWYSAQCIQRIKGGIVVRKFKQAQWYRDADYREPKSGMEEMTRILVMDDGKIRGYYYGLYKNKKYRFILDKDYEPDKGYYYSKYYSTSKLYTRNLKSLKRTALKDSTIDLWEKGNLPTTVLGYLTIEKANKAVEKLVKIGMFKLAKELIRIGLKEGIRLGLMDNGETELVKILRIDGARLKRLRSIDGGIVHLKWYQHEKMVDRAWPDEMIKDFGDADISFSDLGFLPIPLKFVKIWNYMKKQKLISGHDLEWIISTWKDYLNMARQAKMNVQSEMIWKPKDMQKAHNEVVMLLQHGEMEKQAKKLEKKWPKVNGILPRLQKFEYADSKFAILAPQEILDIVKEGTALQHCVHTCDFYFDRIQKNETYLFFLRRAGQETIPWYTLEVEAGGNIRQKRTTGDNQNKDFEEAVKFLKKWQEIFIKRMTAEEKELGAKADQARQQEYAKLRADGNRVWHGKLAGKLLADVLEEDFMAVM